MQEAKRTEIKNIDVLSVFIFFGGTFFVIGFMLGLFGNILKIDVITPEIIRIFPFVSKMGSGIFIGILFGILYGLSGGIGFSVFALLYNFFAALFGGLKFGFKD